MLLRYLLLAVMMLTGTGRAWAQAPRPAPPQPVREFKSISEILALLPPELRVTRSGVFDNLMRNPNTWLKENIVGATLVLSRQEVLLVIKPDSGGLRPGQSGNGQFNLICEPVRTDGVPVSGIAVCAPKQWDPVMEKWKLPEIGRNGHRVLGSGGTRVTVKGRIQGLVLQPALVRNRLDQVILTLTLDEVELKDR